MEKGRAAGAALGLVGAIKPLQTGLCPGSRQRPTVLPKATRTTAAPPPKTSCSVGGSSGKLMGNVSFCYLRSL